MTEQAKQELRMMFAEADSVTITIMQEDCEPIDETYDNFEDCVRAILHHELESDVYY